MKKGDLEPKHLSQKLQALQGHGDARRQTTQTTGQDPTSKDHRNLQQPQDPQDP